MSLGDNKLKILYQDTTCLVVDKPAGLIVHPKNIVSKEPTVLSLICDQTGDEYTESMLVHRLDKDTSGVLLLAKSPSDAEFYKQQFKHRTVSKTYRAIVKGRLDKALEINLPIKRKAKHHYISGVHIW